MIAVLDYGIGNLRSAQKALVHLGSDARLVTSAREAERAAGVVLPGVGAFGRCAEALRETGLARVALEAVGSGLPFLAICIGFQLLYESSEEAPGVEGLGVIPGCVRALSPEVKSPQMQWNRLSAVAGRPSGLMRGLGERPWVYFVHSFAPEMNELVVATCDYGGPVVAAVESGSIWGVQFHPEKSGREGLAMLANFVEACGEPRAADASRLGPRGAVGSQTA